jgi:hypothetical protein
MIKEFDMTVQIPYSIQRGVIKNPLADATARLSQAVSLEYMGSAEFEFEFGALPRSLRAIESKLSDVKLTVVNDITDNERSLRVLHTFNDEDFAKYKTYLLRMRNEKLGHLRTKEYVGFDPSYASKYNKTDFWWDVENNVMWSFHKPFMNRITDHLAASFKYMNESL